MDGEVYQWMGNPAPSIGNASIPNVDQTSFVYTSTQSIFTMAVGGKIQLVITFLSPLNAHDMKRQSLPLSYMQVSASSLDGKTHSTQVYTDISAGKFHLHGFPNHWIH